MLGYIQLVKNDNHDWDVDSAPVVITTKDGKQIIASANKNGLLSVLDRSAIQTKKWHLLFQSSLQLFTMCLPPFVRI